LCLFLWDRLFGTLADFEPAKIGIKEVSPQTFIKLVMLGFTMANTSTELSINLEAMIAEVAYYKAEKRNFYPGHEIRDWLEAKKRNYRTGLWKQTADKLILRQGFPDRSRRAQYKRRPTFKCQFHFSCM
jgi:hypothetical protein